MAGDSSDPTLWASRLAEVSRDPLALERLYREASHGGWGRAFADAVDTWYSNDPDDALAAAWFYRLADTGVARIHWRWALPIAALNGLMFWLLSDFEGLVVGGSIPLLFLVGGPIMAFSILLYLAVAGRRRLKLRDAWLLLLPAICGGSVALLEFIPRMGYRSDYGLLAVLDLLVLSLGAIGVYVLASDITMARRFAFLTKSVESIVTGGLFVIVLGILVGITTGLFEALGLQLPELVQRLLIAGVGGMIPVLAVALVYDPALGLSEQTFGEGIGKLVSAMLRIFLPAALIVLAVYVVFIPFRFLEPFQNREVLIIYTLMSFSIVGLLLGVTPMSAQSVGARQTAWLRRGIIGVAALALLVSIYAFAAILTRTIQYGITPNRLAFTGWLLVNAATLALLLFRQGGRSRREHWLDGLHVTFGIASVLYIGWAAVVVLVVPLLFVR